MRIHDGAGSPWVASFLAACPGPGGAKYVSPGRKSWVRRKAELSPGGTAEALTHTLKGSGAFEGVLKTSRRITSRLPYVPKKVGEYMMGLAHPWF